MTYTVKLLSETLFWLFDNLYSTFILYCYRSLINGKNCLNLKKKENWEQRNSKKNFKERGKKAQKVSIIIKIGIHNFIVKKQTASQWKIKIFI